MAELDCAIAYFVEDRFGFPVEFSVVGQIDEKTGDSEIEKVVRCKDCKWWQDNNGGYPHEECRWGKDETPDADDYCSYGERKEEWQKE